MLSRTAILYVFLFSILILSISSFAKTDFEGKIVMKITGKETSNIIYYVKGNETRMEVESKGRKIAFLHNAKDSDSKMLMDEQKMYMEFPQMDMPETDAKEDKSEGKIKKTGEYKEINGYKCEKWTFEGDEQSGEAWMTDELGGFFMLQNPMARNSQEDWKQELVGNYFPMLVNVYDSSGEKELTMEVVSVDKMSLKKDLFEIPADYKKFNMPNMPNMQQH